MITISVCMIVKNEEKVLARCLDSLKGIYDELIVVDTGSTDNTKAIASKYTDKVFDFEWVNDFSKARNFSISKATCDYFYTADADEVLDEENRQKFLNLKAVLDGSVDIVQMRYVNQKAFGTVYNYDEELRAKLYKRIRTFSFIEPVHEMVRIDPIVYDSDIDIIHMPESLHTGRDVEIFEKVIKLEGGLSQRLRRMYARELLISGEEKQFEFAGDYFGRLIDDCEVEGDDLTVACIVMAKASQIKGDATLLLKSALKNVATRGCSEICCILGEFFEGVKDLNEAAIWYYNAAFETEPELSIDYSKDRPLDGLIRVYTALGDTETVKLYYEKKKDM